MYLISLKLCEDIKKAIVPEYFIGGGYGQILLSTSLPSPVKIQCHYQTFHSHHEFTSAQALCTPHAESAAFQTALSMTGTDVQWWQGSFSSLIV